MAYTKKKFIPSVQFIQGLIFILFFINPSIK